MKMKPMKKVYLVLLTLSIALSSCKSSKYADLDDGLYADIQTTQGDIVVKLEFEKTPITTASFVSLAEGTSPFVSDSLKGKKYYEGLLFHRVMKDFMIQGGCPLANGTGNPGYKFMDEFNDSLVHDKKGILSMANAGPTTNGSQFFITHKATPFLNGRHTVFGEVVIGLDVVDSIANTSISKTQRDRPEKDIVMNKVEIIRNGKMAKKFDAVSIMTDYFDKEGERLATIKAEKQAKIGAALDEKKAFVFSIADQKAKAITLPSGLKILSLVDSKGTKPSMGSKVLVKYAGFLEEGTLFDTNYEEVALSRNKFDQRRKDGKGYEPLPMDYSTDSPLVAGFREGLLSMKIGDKIRVFIPSHLGYGAQGSGPIPANSDLVFDLEITGLAH